MSVVPTVDVTDRMAKLVPVEIAVDLGHLPDEEQRLLSALCGAAEKVGRVYWSQLHENSLELAAKMDQMEPQVASYLEFNAGPLALLDHREPWLEGVQARPGLNVFPPDWNRRTLEDFVEDNPGRKDEIMDWYTAVHQEGDSLRAVPYSEHFADQLGPISQLLESVRGIDGGLDPYLEATVKALKTDQWTEAMHRWLDLDGKVDFLIGPWEFLGDNVSGTKAAYQGVVNLVDHQGSRALDAIKAIIPWMQERLPVQESYRPAVSDDQPMVIVNTIQCTGLLRHGYQAVAYTLPNDGKVVRARGTKKIFMRNIHEARWNHILHPIGQKLFPEENLDFDTWFAYVMGHEIGHNLGPALVVEGPRSGDDIPNAIGPSFGGLEEAKASIISILHHERILQQAGLKTDTLTFLSSYLASEFRTMRFGAQEPHAMSGLLITNWLLEDGGLQMDSDGVHFNDLDRIMKDASGFTKEVVEIQGSGDRDRARELVANYGKIGTSIGAVLELLEDLPREIFTHFRPRFTIEKN